MEQPIFVWLQPPVMIPSHRGLRSQTGRKRQPKAPCRNKPRRLLNARRRKHRELISWLRHLAKRLVNSNCERHFTMKKPTELVFYGILSWEQKEGKHFVCSLWGNGWRMADIEQCREFDLQMVPLAP
jgi:hypothetical protein